MIAKVVPAVRLPVKAGEAFDYFIPDALTPAIQRGSVVVIPFSGRKISGLVIDVATSTDSGKKLKEIYGLAQGLSPLPSYIVDLWIKLAKIFATTLPRFVWAALATVPHRAVQTRSPAPYIGVTVSESNRDPAFDSAQADIAHGDNNIFFINNPSDTLKVVRSAIEQARGKQVLILVPTVDEVMTWQKILGNAAAFHSALATGAKYNLSCAAANGTAKIVVGTKSAVFLPFVDLAQIVIVSAGSSSHMQEDQYPRFDARVVASELSAATGAKLTCLDALLPLGLLSRGATSGNNEPRVFTPIVHDLHNAAKAAHARVLITDELQTAIDETIAASKRALIILNRRGVSTAQVCQSCGTMVVCPNCDIPLTIHHDRMSCFSCERLYPLLDACPKCNGIELKSIGSGSKTLFEMLKKRHPAIKMVHVDRDTWQTDLDQARVVVGTTAVFSSLGPDPKPFDLAADALMGAGQAKSGIWSTEASARILRALGSLLVMNGQLHVQVFDPTAPALLSLNAPFKFIKTELDERTAFGYPPSKILITIFGAGATEEALWQEANDLTVLLRSKYPETPIIEPQWSRPKLFRGKYRLVITVKIGHGQNYADLIQYLPAGFVAGVNKL